ncbi:Protein-arginine deiminase type-1 [Paramyrothecium foliicola]|nr:Protein-arginine deiminase type-1 [Paramyrothecium foliicola]
MGLLSRVGAAAITLCGVAAALKVTTLADTNRDGKVDASDATGKREWIDTRGALILANIADTDRRCTEGTLAPLITLPIEDISSGAVGSIVVKDAASASKIRVFAKGADNDWEFVYAAYNFSAQSLANGLSLGIDARDVRRETCDGRVTVIFSVTDGETTDSDEVALRVAPVLTHHHQQTAERVFTASARGIREPQWPFVGDLVTNVAAAGITAPVHEFWTGDIWVQDWFEAAYSSIPGPEGPVVIRIMIRSAQPERWSGGLVFTDLRDASLGAVQIFGGGLEADSLGNLETIPAYTHNMESYTAGRIILGTYSSGGTALLPFLQAQETQEPLLLDTSWLMAGGMSELLQFLPVDSERGWVLVVTDPRLGVSLLQDAVANGQGGVAASSRPFHPYDNTIPGMFSRSDYHFADDVLETLKVKTGLANDEIYRIPGLFYDTILDCTTTSTRAGTGGRDSRQVRERPVFVSEKTNLRQNSLSLVSFYPTIIGGVVLTNSTVLTANPWGPVIEGKDIFAFAAEKVYASLGFDLSLQDTWFSHHVSFGSLHGGTNVWRAASTPWWRPRACQAT